MDDTNGLNLSAEEIAKIFADPTVAAKYPPILTLEEAAELVREEVETLRSWRSRGRLTSCSVKPGRRVRFFRDRLLLWYLNESMKNG